MKRLANPESACIYLMRFVQIRKLAADNDGVSDIKVRF
jgi:hypothetical protein